jgi:antitoxin component YwqK of YwqJK toxin-antitoxin module
VNGIYVGELNELGQKHGRGVLINKSDKGKYVGYFMNDMKEKEGKMYNKNGQLIYEGMFVNDKPSGKGVYYLQDGNVVDGEFDEYGTGKGRIVSGPGKSNELKSFYAFEIVE